MALAAPLELRMAGGLVVVVVPAISGPSCRSARAWGAMPRMAGVIER
jgi:hypothetical protein